MTAVACPRCGGPSEIVALHRGSGSTIETRYEPAVCWPCIKANVQDARAGTCHCSQVEGEHTHSAVSAVAVSGSQGSGPCSTGAASGESASSSGLPPARLAAPEPRTASPADPSGAADSPHPHENEIDPGVLTDVAGVDH